MKKDLLNKVLALNVLASNYAIGEGEGEGGGEDGSGEGGSDFTQSQAFKDAVASAVASATDGLKTKNDELLRKNREASERAKAFDGLDPDAIKRMMDNFGQDEEAKLIAEGKFQEVLDKRLDTVNAKHSDTLNGLNEELKTYKESAEGYKNQLSNLMIENSVRDIAIDAKAKPEAYEDILRRATDVFSIGEDGKLEARDSEGNLMKTADGEYLLTPERFVSALKKTHPHYWPSSESSGASGSGDSAFEANDAAKQLEEMARSGNIDMDRYRKLSRKARGVKD